MKFLCVECDEAMALVDTRGPDRGSMTVVFVCPSCERRTAMLTNASETQVVRSLGVKIGGRTVEAEPMEGIRSGLAGARPAAGEGHGAPEHAEASHSAGPEPGHGGDGSPSDGTSKCPFTGMVNEAFEADAVSWSDAARTRMEKIPSYARSMVMKGVEEFAREEGVDEVTVDVLDRARGQLGM
ncbi:MAG: PCP reductase family protein [Rhodothermales bacterium]